MKSEKGVSLVSLINISCFGIIELTFNSSNIAFIYP